MTLPLWSVTYTDDDVQHGDRWDIRNGRAVVIGRNTWPPPTGIADAPPGAPSTMGIK